MMRLANRVLRFYIKVAAACGIGFGAAQSVKGWVGNWIGVGCALAAAALWGIFVVPGDPARTGDATIAISGRTRLALELVLLAFGVLGLHLWGRSEAAVSLMVMIAVHYALAKPRVVWLLRG